MIAAIPEKPVLSFRHPLVDSQGDGSFRTESRASFVHLSAGRADLLVTARAVGDRAILVTDSLSRLSEPLLALMRETGASWVIREADGGFSDGLTGRLLERFDTVAGGSPTGPHELSPRFLAADTAAGPTWQRLRVIVARRHRADLATRLGGDLESLASAAGAAPTGWGLHEPAARSWTRDGLTAFARGAMPNATRVVAVGSADRPLAASIVTHRTTKGVEEITELVVPLGESGSDEAARVVAELPATLARLAEGMPLIALAFTDTGSRDLSRAPVRPGPVSPAGLLVGAPGVRQLGIDPDAAIERFGARPVGRPRLPAVVFPFVERAPAERWAALRDVLSSVGHDRLSAALGRDTTSLLRLDDDGGLGAPHPDAPHPGGTARLDDGEG